LHKIDGCTRATWLREEEQGRLLQLQPGVAIALRLLRRPCWRPRYHCRHDRPTLRLPVCSQDCRDCPEHVKEAHQERVAFLRFQGPLKIPKCPTDSVWPRCAHRVGEIWISCEARPRGWSFSEHWTRARCARGSTGLQCSGRASGREVSRKGQFDSSCLEIVRVL
jgi:hypothetical protein